jgi:hypothetical protein
LTPGIFLCYHACVTIPLKHWGIIGLLSLFTWAWLLAGGYLGFAFATQTLHLHSFWLIAPITVAYALGALLILPLLGAAISILMDARISQPSH